MLAHWLNGRRPAPNDVWADSKRRGYIIIIRRAKYSQKVFSILDLEIKSKYYYMQIIYSLIKDNRENYSTCLGGLQRARMLHLSYNLKNCDESRHSIAI